MAFNSATTPFLFPPSANGATYSCDQALNVVVGDATGLSLIQTATELTFNTIGAINSLSNITSAGILYSAGGSIVDNTVQIATITAGNGITIDQTDNAFIFSARANSIAQNINVQANGTAITGTPASTLNIAAGTGTTISAAISSGVATYTINQSSVADNTATYVTLTDETDTLTNSFSLGSLGNGLLKQTVTDDIAILEIADPGVDYQDANVYLTNIASTDPFEGSILFYNGTEYTTFPIGIDGYVLTSNGTTLTWDTFTGQVPSNIELLDTSVTFTFNDATIPNYVFSPVEFWIQNPTSNDGTTEVNLSNNTRLQTTQNYVTVPESTDGDYVIAQFPMITSSETYAIGNIDAKIIGVASGATGNIFSAVANSVYTAGNSQFDLIGTNTIEYKTEGLTPATFVLTISGTTTSPYYLQYTINFPTALTSDYIFFTTINSTILCID